LRASSATHHHHLFSASFYHPAWNPCSRENSRGRGVIFPSTLPWMQTHSDPSVTPPPPGTWDSHLGHAGPPGHGEGPTLTDERRGCGHQEKKTPRRAPEPLAIKTTRRVPSKVITPPHSPRPRRCVWYLFFPISSPRPDLDSSRTTSLTQLRLVCAWAWTFPLDLTQIPRHHPLLSTNPSILIDLRFIELSSSQADQPLLSCSLEPTPCHLIQFLSFHQLLVTSTTS
jgi:hypothetical protein